MRLVFACFLLYFLLIFSNGCQSRRPESAQPVTIKIVMKRYSIEPNSIRLKQGQTTTLEVSTADVQHGFSIEALKVDEPIQPGKPATIHVTPQQKGRFNVECDIVCGPGHDNMQGTVIVE
jgi:cytochrome c oxidase subunit II